MDFCGGTQKAADIPADDCEVTEQVKSIVEVIEQHEDSETVDQPPLASFQVKAPPQPDQQQQQLAQ